MGYEHLFIFSGVCIATWFLIIYFLPRMLLSVYKRAILKKGFGDGPIPINTLYVEPKALLADPIHLPAGASKLATTGVNRDTLYVAGWLDLVKGPLVLHVPDFSNRYYSMQFTDPSKNINFAYVGTRATGTKAGDHLVTGPGWKGVVPEGMTRISSPSNSVMVFGRVLVYNDNDLSTAYDLAKQMQLMPFSE
ncbi:MAG TPA: DUF1254 domain-containing protein [Candidatus Paceibacterota bacterium]|jgi:hypothetical protein|nr:DUF1254 domain-containing protein [Candidatus Paceibacterota bacterium]